MDVAVDKSAGWWGRLRMMRARRYMERIANAVRPRKALVVTCRSGRDLSGGVFAKRLVFTLEIWNVSPVVLKLGSCTILAAGAYNKQRAVRGRRQFYPASVELLPGGVHVVECDIDAQAEQGASMTENQAVHLEVKVGIEMYGPAEALCTTIKKTCSCWMKCGEPIDASSGVS